MAHDEWGTERFGSIKPDGAEVRGLESNFQIAPDGLVTASYSTVFRGTEPEAIAAGALTGAGVEGTHPTAGMASLMIHGFTVNRIAEDTFRINRQFYGAKDDAFTRTIKLTVDSSGEPIETHGEFDTWIGVPDEDGEGSNGAMFKARETKGSTTDDADNPIDTIEHVMDDNSPFSHFLPFDDAGDKNKFFGLESYLAPRLTFVSVVVAPWGTGWGLPGIVAANNPIYNVGQTYTGAALVGYGAPAIGNRNWLLTNLNEEKLGGALRMQATWAASSIQTDEPWNDEVYDAS
tara:strand:- start:22 stop:891 length:870 start_codon:yes stop_codon:yes gene_type:complete